MSAPGSIPRTITQKLSEHVSVLDFGAKGDGATDDTAAIGSAIVFLTTVSARGGGRLYFPAGTYLCTPPTTANILPIGSNVWIHGDGIGVSIIKVADSAGSYDAVFGPKYGVLQNVTISHITIDQNSTGNPVISTSEINSHPRFLISSAAGSSSLTLDHVEVTEIQSINTVYSHAPNTIITNCRFTGIGGGTFYHDHSTLYMATEGAVVANNFFASSGYDSPGATTAIETHGGRHMISGNQIYKMEIGMNITGIADTDSEAITIIGNSIYGCYYGIFLWSQAYSAHTTGFGLAGLDISGNAIRVRQTQWTVNPGGGSGMSGNPVGIGIIPTADMPLSDVSITGNEITFDLETSAGAPAAQGGFGIGYWDSLNAISVFGLKISGNLIENSPITGVRFSAQGSDIEISGNQIINPGSTLNTGAVAAPFRSGIFVSTVGGVTGVRILDNSVTDNLAVTRMCFGEYVSVSTGAPDLISRGNIFTVLGDAVLFAYPLTPNANNPTLLMDDSVYAPNATHVVPGVQVRPGSRMHDIYNNRRYRVNGTGVAWASDGFGTAAPTTGTWGGGDTIYNTTPSGASPIFGWICVSPGTPGTWAPVTAIDLSGDVALAGALVIGGAIEMANTKAIYWKNAAGAYIPVLGVYGADQLNIQNPGNQIGFLNSAATVAMLIINDTGVNLPSASGALPLKVNSGKYMIAAKIDLGSGSDVQATGLTSGKIPKWDGSKLIDSVSGDFPTAPVTSVNGATGAVTITAGGIGALLASAGVSHTVTLAKLTVGGANGSLTIVNGQITGVSDPT